MTLYMVLFLLGFVLAVGLLAYTSTQVAELSKRAESFNVGLVERYSKPLRDLAELDKDKKQDNKAENKTDSKTENKAESKTENKAEKKA